MTDNDEYEAESEYENVRLLFHQKRPDPEKDYPGYKVIHERICVLTYPKIIMPEINKEMWTEEKFDKYIEEELEDLRYLRDEVNKLENWYRSNLGGMSGYPTYYKQWFELIDNREKLFLKHSKNTWYSPIIMKEEEEVNGYKLYEVKSKNIMTYGLLMEFVEKWKEEMSIEDFKEKFDDIACSDWSKMDEHGECYGGYYNYSKGSYERENAYTLSGKRNLEKLCELPYPKAAIIETIFIGCRNRMESVRYSNFMCEWAKRKMIQMNIPPFHTTAISLKNLCVDMVKEMDVDKTKLPNELENLVQKEEQEIEEQEEIGSVQEEKIDTILPDHDNRTCYDYTYGICGMDDVD